MKLDVMKNWIGFDGTPRTSIVYWAKYEHFTNPINEGYIGITYKTLEERKQRHFHEVKHGCKGYFKNVLKNNGHLVQWFVLNSNITELMSEKIEFFLRSKENIGWNTVCGGGKPPKSKKGCNKGKPSPNKGKTCPEHVKQAVSKANSGKIPHNKGIKHTEEEIKKMSKPRSEIGKKNISNSLLGNTKKRDKTLYTFSHSEHGVINCTKFDLYTKYDLCSGHISSIVLGKRESHKGWKFVK